MQYGGRKFGRQVDARVRVDRTRPEASRPREGSRKGRAGSLEKLGEQAAAAAAGGALTGTYITLQLLLRGGLAEPSRADHFAAAHGARREGSRAGHRRGRWRRWTRSGHGRHTQPTGTRRFPRRGGRAPRALGRRSSLSSADPRTEAEPEREPRGPELAGLLSVHPPGRQARRPAASAAVGLGWDSAGTRSRELDAPRSAPWGRDLPRALPAADPTLHAHTQCPRAVSAPLRPLALSVSGARSFPSPCSEEGAREGVRRPDGSGRRDRSRSA